jgi:hypothetical protein
MRYTQGQIRALLGLSEETIRYWKRELSVLHDRRGHGAVYSLADLLALAAIQQITSLGGGRISLLTAVSDRIFEACERVIAPGHETAFLLIASDQVFIATPDTPRQMSPEQTCFLVPVGAILTKLRRDLQGDMEVSPQLTLPLGPIPTP